MYDPEETLCVLVVDAADVVHWALRALLGAEPWVDAYVSAYDAERATELAKRYRPDVALVDLAVGASSGLDVCASLRAASAETRVLLMSPHRRLPARSARGVGASGVVWKGAGARDVVRAVRLVSLGMTLFAGAERGTPTLLTPRERDVLTLMAAGATNAEAARRLKMAESTLKQHVRAVYRKLNAKTRVEAIRRAQAAGLFD
ncbi:MAG TPA: response regulator transcription factor [Thermoleophilaceae bacterium]|nr:response regulator transcription factor [Thermoleophilaceae bacterium]